MASDIDYWRGRAAEERERAMGCKDAAVARLHRQLADLCEERVRTLAEGGVVKTFYAA